VGKDPWVKAEPGLAGQVMNVKLQRKGNNETLWMVWPGDSAARGRVNAVSLRTPICRDPCNSPLSLHVTVVSVLMLGVACEQAQQRSPAGTDDDPRFAFAYDDSGGAAAEDDEDDLVVRFH